MSVLKILNYPDKRLRIIAKPVNKINTKIKNIVNDMIETMNHKDGIGLAATQINVQLQIIVINKIEKQKNYLILINPKIIKRIGLISIEEGCLSIPQYHAFVPRSNYIKVEAMNLDQQKIEIEAESILSICIQHEIDHLIGKLFIDYLSPLKKERIRKKFIKIARKKNTNFLLKETV